MTSPSPIIHRLTRFMVVLLSYEMYKMCVVRVVLFRGAQQHRGLRDVIPSAGDESASGVGAILGHGTPLQPAPSASSGASSPMLRRRSSTNSSRAALRCWCQAYQASTRPT